MNMLIRTLGAVCLFVLPGCDFGFGGDKPRRPPPAEVLRVDVTPSPVAVGDTAVLRAITDRPVLSYGWTLEAGQEVSARFDSLIWVAPDTAGTYRASVTLSEGAFVLDDFQFAICVDC